MMLGCTRLNVGITWLMSFSVMMVLVGPTAGSFDSIVVASGESVDDDTDASESFVKASVPLRHCRYNVLETSNGSTKMIRKEKYQATSTAMVTTKCCRNQFPYEKSRAPDKTNVAMTSKTKTPADILNQMFEDTRNLFEFDFEGEKTKEKPQTKIKVVQESWVFGASHAHELNFGLVSGNGDEFIRKKRSLVRGSPSRTRTTFRPRPRASVAP